MDCLDIHQAMSICQEHNLFDAIIYIYNNAMLDYITPVEKLLRVLTRSKEPGDEVILFSQLVNTLNTLISLFNTFVRR